MAKRASNLTVRAKSFGPGKYESAESLIRRFKRKVEKTELIYDIKKKEYYLSPSEKRRLKSKLARRRAFIEEKKRAAKFVEYDK